MNISRSGPVLLIFPVLFLTLAGCYPKTDEVKELYERQAALEAKIDKLSKDMEAGLTRIDQDVDTVEAGQRKLETDVDLLKLKTAEVPEKVVVRPEPRKTAKSTKTAQGKPKPDENTPEYIFSNADSNYADGKYEDAILEYQKLIDTYPRDRRVPAAYLKQGLSLINLGRKQEAKYFLNTLIDKYPDSKEAQT
ncbi:MAG TPA: tetratricopeptide repeat protein, partial [Thermodesulfobacteriota bacterium]|nr:tetratricopeptide repeat protein [Thermodesulfobacteriota bacterium]